MAEQNPAAEHFKTDSLTNFGGISRIPVGGPIFDAATRWHRKIVTIGPSGNIGEVVLPNIDGISDEVIDEVYSQFVHDYLSDVDDVRLKDLRERYSKGEVDEELVINENEEEILGEEYEKYLLEKGIISKKDLKNS